MTTFGFDCPIGLGRALREHQSLSEVFVCSLVEVPGAVAFLQASTLEEVLICGDDNTFDTDEAVPNTVPADDQVSEDSVFEQIQKTREKKLAKLAIDERMHLVDVGCKVQVVRAGRTGDAVVVRLFPNRTVEVRYESRGFDSWPCNVPIAEVLVTSYTQTTPSQYFQIPAPMSKSLFLKVCAEVGEGVATLLAPFGVLASVGGVGKRTKLEEDEMRQELMQEFDGVHQTSIEEVSQVIYSRLSAEENMPLSEFVMALSLFKWLEEWQVCSLLYSSLHYVPMEHSPPQQPTPLAGS
jgi:hypothetical protein